jgi:hypothetical protein
MAIWRGAGGSGDATTDAANQASVASTKAAEAAASALAAAGSATAADVSDTQANTSKIAAATSETNAANSASAASTSATNAASSASAASTSASNAATSETNASNSASTASTQATNASNSAATASTQASNASTSASNAATSETNAAASFDSFDDRYLGAKSSDPTVDNDGNALLTGALYFNSTAGVMNVYNGSAWLAAYVSAAGVLLQANNLSDVANAGTSRTNLGLVIGTDVQAFSSVLAGTTASYTTAEETKLSGIETGATADQTGAQIKTAYEAETNAFTDAQFTKLAGIETAATADQTAGEIKTAYESNADTNAFTDAQVTKLSGIATSADVTGTTNVTAAGALMDSEVTNLAQVKAFDTTDYATAAQGALAASATQPATTVAKTSATGSAVMPTGTTAQRDGSPATGYLRFNSTDTSFEGYDGSAWGAIGGGGGASGGGTDAVFYENGKVITTSYSITADTNAMSTGPLTVNSGVSVTVPSGSRWVVL